MTPAPPVVTGGRRNDGAIAPLLMLALALGASCGTSTPSNPGETGNGGANGDGGASGGGASGTGTGGSATGSGGTTSTGTGGRGGAGGGGGAVVPPPPPMIPGLGGAPGNVACAAPIGITTGTAATVTVDLTQPTTTVSPDMMGVHTSVYDSNMQVGTTPLYLKAANVTSLRYPGGSYSDIYHWELHTGISTPASGVGSNTIYIAAGADFGNFVKVMESAGANALITVNYGTNPDGSGPGVPQEAAAWVAYANGAASNNAAIGMDANGKDWRTVSFWAGLRSATPLATDDGYNLLRINHPAPIGIKYWEVGNEIYGNGFYFGGCGWEGDLHVPYTVSGTTCAAGRQGNLSLAPAVYGAAVKAFSIAMKAVDPSIKVGGIVVWPPNSYSGWNAAVLTAACANMDFAVNHWYAGKTLTGTGPTSLLNVAENDIPMMFSSLRTTLATAAYHCAANMPIAVTEWGPNTLTGNVVIPPSTITAAPVGSQAVGLFAAEAYANFMQQGALAVHWLELHNSTYLAGVDLTNDPFTIAPDSPRWGYHGQRVAHFLASGNDKVLATPPAITNAGALAGVLKAHASLHADGGVSVMLTNTSPATAANVTVNVTGATMACVGSRYSYNAVNGDQDGDLAFASIFSNTAGNSVPVGVPPYSTVVVIFPKK